MHNKFDGMHIILKLQNSDSICCTSQDPVLHLRCQEGTEAVQENQQEIHHSRSRKLQGGEDAVGSQRDCCLNAGILIVPAVKENHDDEFHQAVSFLQDIPEEKFCLRGGATAGVRAGHH